MTVAEQLSALSAILAQRSIHSLFQPIMCLSEQRVFGHEALSRGPSNSPLHAPLNLFTIARQAGRLTELEAACRESACRRFSEQQLQGKLFLNISPESLLEPHYPSGQTLKLLGQVGLPPSRVVIELTEHTPTDDFREVWWDPDATSGQNGKQGAWIDPSPGTRYLPGQVPKAPGAFFQGGQS